MSKENVRPGKEQQATALLTSLQNVGEGTVGYCPFKEFAKCTSVKEQQTTARLKNMQNACRCCQ